MSARATLTRASRDRGRRCAVAVVTALAALACMQGGQATAAQPLAVSLGGGSSFPARSVVLSLSARPAALSSAQVHVTENGQPVADETLNPISLAPAGDYGLVLAIDSGPSMQGAAIDQAMAAARAIAAQRTAGQELGLLLFDQTPTVKLPLTQDPTAIQQALAQPPALGPVSRHRSATGAKARHIFDGVQLALQQLTAAHIAAGAVIVLSNGADQNSQVALQSIATTANGGHVRIFTVGLRNRFFRAATLAALAKVGGGSFTEANPSELKAIFTRIETSLTSRYVVRYRSLAPYGKPIQVAVTVDGVRGTAGTTYTTPAAPPTVEPTKNGIRHAAPQPFWRSSLAFALAACAGGLLLGFAVVLLLGSGLRRGRIRARVGEFVGPAITSGGSAALTVAMATPPRAGVTERALERSPLWAQFKENVEIARVSRSPLEIVYITAAATIAVAALLTLLVGSALIVLPVLVGGPLIVRAIIGQRVEAQRRLFGDQLASHLQEIAAAMRAGHSLVSGMTLMAETATEPTKGEFQRALADEALGMTLDDALTPVARRMASEDVEQVGLIISLHRRTGGNVAEVLDRIADSVRERAELRRELRSLTAQARLSRYIVTALPPGILLVLSVLNPDYSKPLFHTTGGVVLLVIAGCLVIAGSLVMRALVDIKP